MRDVVVLTEVKLAGVQLTEDPGSGRYRGRLRVHVRLTDASGELVSRISHDAPLSGPLAERSRRQAGRLLLRRTLRLAPGTYKIETAVRDEESGRLSASRSELQVPAMDSTVAVGSLALVRRTEAAPAENDADPLLMGRVAVVPTPEPLPVDPVEPAIRC
jgi:hypothetical protein